MFRICCLLAVATFLNSCSSLLYFPARHQFTPPEILEVKPKDLWIPVPEGGKINLWYFKNPKQEKPKALLLFFHGNAQNISAHFLALYWVLQFGYDFAIFDYRGFGRSHFNEAEFRRGEDDGPSPESTVQDGMAFLRWGELKRRELGVPLVVFAQSLGGAVAMRSYVDVKSEMHLDWMIIDSSFPSYRAAGRRALGGWWITWPLQWIALLVLSDQYAPEERIAEISPTPILVVHGDADETVPIDLGRQVFQRAKEPKAIWEVPGGRHTDAFYRHGGRFRKLLLDELAKLQKK